MDEVTAREFQALRELIIAREQALRELIAAREESLRDKIDANDRHRDAMSEAWRVHRQALEERMNRLNNVRAQMAEQAATFINRNEFEEAKASGAERFDQTRTYIDNKLDAVLAPIRTALDRMDRPNWEFIAAIASLLVGLVAGVWLVIGLKIDTTVAPLNAELNGMKQELVSHETRLTATENLSSASTRADSESRTDRGQLNERIRQVEAVSATVPRLSSDNANLRDQYNLIVDRQRLLLQDITTQKAALVEVETQFCSSDYMRNLMHAYDLRMFAMLWHKVYVGETFPTDNAYYPRIGKCGGESVVTH